MVAVPGLNPNATPEVIPIVAIAGALLIHVPPPTPSLNVVEVHKSVLPAIGAGAILTVTTIPDIHPEPFV